MAERLHSESAWWVGFYGKSNNCFRYLYSASIKNTLFGSIRFTFGEIDVRSAKTGFRREVQPPYKRTMLLSVGGKEMLP